jgi:uncharacterized protein YoxC
MDMLNTGGLILALVALVYAIQLGLQLKKLKEKISELERIENELLKKK